MNFCLGRAANHLRFAPSSPIDFSGRHISFPDFAHFLHLNQIEWDAGATGMEFSIQTSAGAGFQYTRFFCNSHYRKRTIFL